jgi:hypothetical protein
MGSESYIYINQQLESLNMWCDAREPMTHFQAIVAPPLGSAQAVIQKGEQSLFEVKSAIAVPFVSLDYFVICL